MEGTKALPVGRVLVLKGGECRPSIAVMDGVLARFDIALAGARALERASLRRAVSVTVGGYCMFLLLY
jgi:hypothetical protein